jgi:alpha-N-arabinofuranosidase
MRVLLVALGVGVALVNAPGPARAQAQAKAAGAQQPAAPVVEERVAIDAGVVGQPLPPLLFGQFIEHLGRCIYGGLWAEMLEDRKFYYPVTGAAPAWEMFTPGPSTYEGEGHPYELLARSPWLIVGDHKAVTMERQGALAGEHSPRIAVDGPKAAAGLEQERLALREGREYGGRIVLAGDASATPIEVSLAWGGGASDRQTVTVGELGPQWKTVPLHFRAGGSTDNGRLSIVGRGSGSFRIGAVSLMPTDNVLGWRRDTLERLRELNAPVYRWPGGNFVSGYDWKDGVGDPDRRPPRKNPAWKGVEANDVGLHEFMDLCHLIGAEPYVAVNTGLGGARSAAELVEYANGAASTPMGRLRAERGHARPFGVRLWAVGNEMYGEWQLGHMPLEKYVAKHREVVAAMRAVDPQIRPVGVGAAGEWSRTMLARAASEMSLISEHLYWQSKDDVAAHVAQAKEAIQRVAESHRAYRREIPALQRRPVKVALDEWNYWYGPNEYGELGVRYFLKDALGIAAGLHQLFRDADVFEMANYAQTVNVIGAIKTTKTQAEMEPTGLVLALYRQHFGTLPVPVRQQPAPLDVSVAWTADRSALSVAVVNPTRSARSLAVEITGARLSERSRRFVLTGEGPLAHNGPGRRRGVSVEATTSRAADRIELPPLSVVLLVIDADANSAPAASSAGKTM